MNKIFFRLFFVFSIIWGLCYPVPLRYPIYIWITPLLLLSSKSFRDIKFLKFKRNFYLTIKNFLISKNCIFFIPIIFSIYLWEPYNFIYSVALIIFVLVIRRQFKYEYLEENDWIYKSCLISIVFVALSIPFVGSFHETVPASPGPYPEPSHLGFSLGPVLGLLTRKKKYSLLGIIGIAFFCIFSFSKSLILGYFFSLILSTRLNFKLKSRKAAVLIIIFLIIIISFKAIIMLRVEGLSENEIDYSIFASSLIWFYWLKNSFLELLVNPLGMGPFGWLNSGLENPLLIPECNYEVLCKYSGEFVTSLNQRDLASLTAFGISSFGFLFPFYLFLLINRICKNTINNSKNYFQLEPISILLISYICIYMFRWTGFTAGPFLGLICLMPKKINILKPNFLK